LDLGLLKRWLINLDIGKMLYGGAVTGDLCYAIS
jgi:hypothetical protein